MHSMDIIKVKIKGTAPLLHNKFVPETGSKTKKKITYYDPQKEAEKVLYTDDAGNVVQPAIHMEAGLIKSATDFKIPGGNRKTFKDAFKGGIFVEPKLIHHINPSWVVDEQSVVIQKARIMRARPRFDEWSLEFEIQNIDERISTDLIKEVLENLGKYQGIGDNRPRYGRFMVEAFDVIQKMEGN